jgi:hypothetical protein
MLDAAEGKVTMNLNETKYTYNFLRASKHLTPFPPEDEEVEEIDSCCGDSRSYRTQTMRENKNSRTKTQNKGQPKALYSTVYFSKVDPLYMRRSVSFYREEDGLFTSRGYPRAKRI